MTSFNAFGSLGAYLPHLATIESNVSHSLFEYRIVSAPVSSGLFTRPMMADLFVTYRFSAVPSSCVRHCELLLHRCSSASVAYMC